MIKWRHLRPGPARGESRSVLYAAELGETFSHLATFVRVAAHLQDAGHRIHLAVPDVTEAAALLGDRTYSIVQSPQRPATFRIWSRRMPFNYAEVLGRFGFFDPAALAAMVKAWLDLFALAKPDLLVSNHSPSSLLAARAAGLPHVVFGTGFWAPPRLAPMPCLWPQLKVPGSQLATSEHAILRVMNEVLSDLGVTPLNLLSDLFGLSRENFLCTFRELDPYGEHRGDDARYCGPSLADEHGTDPAWSGQEVKRIFVRFDRPTPMTARLLKELEAVDAAVIASIPGTAPMQTRSSASRTHLFNRRVKPISLRGNCDLAICGGSIETVSSMMMSGIPLALFPNTPEQTTTSRQVSKLGVGILATAKPDGQLRTATGAYDDFATYGALTESLLGDNQLRSKSTAFRASLDSAMNQNARSTQISLRLTSLLRES